MIEEKEGEGETSGGEGKKRRRSRDSVWWRVLSEPTGFINVYQLMDCQFPKSHSQQSRWPDPNDSVNSVRVGSCNWV
jgi:hypothetical protein